MPAVASGVGPFQLVETPSTPASSTGYAEADSPRAVTPPLPTVQPTPPPRSRKEVKEDVAQRNVMAWLERQAAQFAAAASPAPAAPATPEKSLSEAVSSLAAPIAVGSPRQPSDPGWLLATGSPRAAFWARVAELCRETPTTYLRVKKQLVAEFGVRIFREQRSLIQDQMLSSAVADIPSADKEALRQLHDHVRAVCQQHTTSGEPITWLHLKKAMVDQFGERALTNFKRPIQAWLKFYTKDGDADLTSPEPIGGGDLAAAEDTPSSRLARRKQLREDLQSRLSNKCSLSDDERSLMLEQLDELDRVIVGIEEEEEATVPAPDSPLPFSGISLVDLPPAALVVIFGLLPTYTYLAVLPRVCRRLRDWVCTAESPPLSMPWSRRVLSDRVVKVNFLANLGQVTALDLQRCARLTDSACTTIAKSCTSLQALDLGGCDRITDAGVIEIATSCQLLVRWGLFECPRISHSAILHIARTQPNLERLVLGSEELPDESALESLTSASLTAIAKRCSRLASVRLRAVPAAVQGGGLTSLLQQCPPLVDLELSQCDVPARIGSMLSPLRGTLREVCLAGNPHLSDSAVVSLVTSCTLVTSIDLSGCKGLTDATISDGLARHGHRFVRVNLARCTHVSDIGLKALATAGRRLRHLDLAFCDHITDVGIANIARRCPNLCHLDVTCCIQLTAAAIIVVGEHLRQIRTLLLRGCPSITDSGLHAIAKGCPMLEELSVWECSLITDDGVGTILNRCPLVWRLIVCSCPLITNITADLVRKLSCSALTDVSHAGAGFTARGLDRLQQRLDYNRSRSGASKGGATAWAHSRLVGY